MADKPLPKITIPASSSGRKAAKLSYKQLRSLWIQAGGDPALASTMAAIALAESGGRPDALNDRAPDYSVGPWQINYYADLRGPRTRAYGTPEKLRSDPLANARAAVDIFSRQGLGAWTTYTSGAYRAFLTAQTPQEKVAESAALAQAQASSPEYLGAAAAVSAARASARDQAHLSDPWVTVQQRGGQVTGFGEAYGANPPENVLRAGGQPLTASGFSNLWGARYDSVFQEFTGRAATAAEQADIIGQGLSYYALRDRLSKSPQFKASPAWKASAAGLQARAETMLGVRPPDEIVRKALAEGWDQATFDAKVRAHPLYTKGPEYKAAFTSGREVYRTVFGQPDKAGNAWIKQAVLQNWTQDQMAAALRAQPEYKYSPEAQAKTIAFLDAMGLFTGSRPVLEEAGPELPDTGNVLSAFREETDKKPDPLSPGLPRMQATLRKAA